MGVRSDQKKLNNRLNQTKMFNWHRPADLLRSRNHKELKKKQKKSEGRRLLIFE
jgi:hypothetical protein